MQVGFIGVTTPSTPKFLLDRYAARFRFTDISDAVNTWVRVLQDRGCTRSSCSRTPAGRRRTSRRAGLRRRDRRRGARDEPRRGRGDRRHSHSRLDIRVPNPGGAGDKLIVEALSYGVAFDQVDLTIDRSTDDVVAKPGDVPPHRTTWPPIRRMAALVERYRQRVARVATKVVGETDRHSRAPAASSAGSRRMPSATTRARTRRSWTRCAARRHRRGADHLRRRRGGVRLRTTRSCACGSAAASSARSPPVGSTPGRATSTRHALHRRGERDAPAPRPAGRARGRGNFFISQV